MTGPAPIAVPRYTGELSARRATARPNPDKPWRAGAPQLAGLERLAARWADLRAALAIRLSG
jgi:hypothetical protein